MLNLPYVCGLVFGFVMFLLLFVICLLPNIQATGYHPCITDDLCVRGRGKILCRCLFSVGDGGMLTPETALISF